MLKKIIPTLIAQYILEKVKSFKLLIRTRLEKIDIPIAKNDHPLPSESKFPNESTLIIIKI